ncbi:sulfatase-like hydrolase/transferase [Aliiglaciecola lipolytica]|uniref:sulfatase-like hydrolase/transferase n=1 Tax=Aliiglaciecola lipolytica TaxID=477689 RepID=UPI001C07F349|nr:sulfatase-like hydrolase/transferase [Aliiglaciecola lipolytica]MBU2877928.1 sulfatase-like hydrolase/transferase [Aliiglaciecola lipolytica]
MDKHNFISVAESLNLSSYAVSRILQQVRIVGLASLICLGLAACGSTKSSNNNAHSSDKPLVKQPNIIYIFADDWGWGDLSVHGNKQVNTPNIDKLAAEGTDFYQFSVSSPVCSPSRAAVMTGQFPSRNNINQHFATIKHHERAGMPDWLDAKAAMLPRVLKDAGYATGHFGKWHLTNVQIEDAPLPTEYGYDEYGAFNLPGYNMPPSETANQAIDFIKRHKDQPFFVNLWIHETHTPHYPEPALMKEYGHLNEQEMLYSAIIAAGDRDVGRIMALLKELNIDDNTLVIFSSDNGPEVTGERKFMDDDSTGPGFGTFYSVGKTLGLKGAKRSLYAGGVRVPFIARWPGVVPAGAIDKNSVLNAVDLLPTFADLAGATLPAEYVSDGQSIRLALAGETFERSKTLYWVWPPGKGSKSTATPNWPNYGILKGDWKLLVNDTLKIEELYQVKEDWYEENNVAAQHPEVVKALRGEMLRLQQQFPATIPEHVKSKLRDQN